MRIALYHFHVEQIKRSKGQSAIAAAAYRSGEKLHSEYYGEDSDYTRKGGVICSEILLPPHAPSEYADRETLWNAVEKVERGKKAQLAYSFDIALQNEFSMEENIALARQFLLDNFVSRGMIVDFAVHSPDKEDGGISNPHFHVMCPTLAHEKVNSNKFGFQIAIGGGAAKLTDNKNASKQALLDAAVEGCFMSGVGDTSANSIGISYDAIVTPVSEAVTNTAIASVLFIIAWDAV